MVRKVIASGLLAGAVGCGGEVTSNENSGGASGSKSGGSGGGGGNGAGGTSGVGATGGAGGTGVGASSGTGGSGGVAGSGGGGSGGDTSTGGSAGSGSNLRCGAGVVVAAGNKPLIDDFNDGDLNIIVSDSGTEDGRAGEFYASMSSVSEVQNTGTELHFVGKANGEWLGFGVPLAICYDASAYSGIRFKIRGQVVVAGNDAISPLRVGLATPPTTPVPTGTCPCSPSGSCDLCYDAFGYTLPLLNATEYDEISIPWEQFRQAGWGTVVPGDYRPETQILELFWVANVSDGEFDVYIDDLELTLRNDG